MNPLSSRKLAFRPSSYSEESFCLSSSPDKQKKSSLGVLCASAVNKLSNNRRDAEFAENICFAQSGDGDWAKTTGLNPSLNSLGRSIPYSFGHKQG